MNNSDFGVQCTVHAHHHNISDQCCYCIKKYPPPVFLQSSVIVCFHYIPYSFYSFIIPSLLLHTVLRRLQYCMCHARSSTRHHATRNRQMRRDGMAYFFSKIIINPSSKTEHLWNNLSSNIKHHICHANSEQEQNRKDLIVVPSFDTVHY